MTTQEKRDRQLIFRDSFRKTGLWCNLDKPPKMRAVSKAVGRLSGFLQGPLKMSKDQLEVGSWPQAKCFCWRLSSNRPHRLSGSQTSKESVSPPLADSRWFQHHSDLTKMWELHFGPGRPWWRKGAMTDKIHRTWSFTLRGVGEPQDHPHPLHDPRQSSALFQYACWNIQGKPITHCIDSLLSSEIDFHIIGLQEATVASTDAHTEQGGLPEVCLHEGYTILHAWTTGCHRRLALCFDEESLTKWSAAKAGHQGFLRRTSSAFFSNRPPPGAVANVPGPCH